MKDKSDKNRGRRLKKVLAALVITTSVVMTLISFVLMLKNYPGMNIAFCIALTVTAIIFIFLILRALRASEKYSRLATALQRFFLICIAICLAGFIVLQGLIISGARSEDTEIDCLIILGAGLYGEYPSRILVSRLDRALEYQNTQNNIPIIVSGGQGPGETITEAEAMSRYLEGRGIDVNQIWKEEDSTSTWENLAYSLALMEENGIDAENATVAIVTNEFHLYRAKRIAGQLGLNAIGVAAETPYPSLRVLYHCREAVALLKDLLVIGSAWGAELLFHTAF